jgi:hypothetical protein
MIIGMAAGAIGELTPDQEVPPGSVELLCQVLKRAGAGQGSKYRIEFTLAEAAWSLGILGRSAAPAAPLLLAILESAPPGSDHLRGLAAESLAEISRGTPDEDRVIASLAKAWKTAPQEQKTVITRALRSLGPKSEKLLPELRQMPADPERTQIRRVRYPRSRREAPVRE